MPLAILTFRQIIELLVLIVVVHAVILAPLVVAVLGAFGERAENKGLRPRH